MNFLQINPNLSAARRAISASYGFKSVQLNTETKRAEFSLVLTGMAFAFFIFRMLWPFQLIKTVVRLLRRKNHVPPVWVELYQFFVVFAWSWFFFLDPIGLSGVWRTVILLLGYLISFEAISANMYYLLLRPGLEINSPHQLYRSFILSLVSLAQFWLSVSAVWFIITNRGVDFLHFPGGAPQPSALSILYFTATTMFTIGYGDITPNSTPSMWLAIGTMMGSFTMASIVIARAVSLIPSLPTVDKPEPPNP